MDPATAAKAKQLVREMRIHETLQHRNILRLFGGETRDECTVRAASGGAETTWPSGLYMVLDLGQSSRSLLLPTRRCSLRRGKLTRSCLCLAADGGDLFDKISESRLQCCARHGTS